MPKDGLAEKMGSVSVKLVRYPAVAWSPHPKAVFQLVMLVPVMPNDGLAEKMGSVSAADENETQAVPFHPWNCPKAFHLMVPAPPVGAPTVTSELRRRRPAMSSFSCGVAMSTPTFWALDILNTQNNKVIGSSFLMTVFYGLR
jgi:hypothetical protein